MAPPQTPHLHPLCERLLRTAPVDPGQAHDLPKYKPLDFLLQPCAVTTLPEAVSALLGVVEPWPRILSEETPICADVLKSLLRGQFIPPFVGLDVWDPSG